MTYDLELTLLGLQYQPDDIGNQTATPTETTILCNEKSTGRNEFYQAAQAGLRPEKVFIIHHFEYGGEQEVKFNGEIYSVIRTYATGTEELELVCEGKAKYGEQHTD